MKDKIKDLLPSGWNVIERDYGYVAGIKDDKDNEYMIQEYKSTFVPYLYVKGQVLKILENQKAR